MCIAGRGKAKTRTPRPWYCGKLARPLPTWPRLKRNAEAFLGSLTLSVHEWLLDASQDWQRKLPPPSSLQPESAHLQRPPETSQPLPWAAHNKLGGVSGCGRLGNSHLIPPLLYVCLSFLQSLPSPSQGPMTHPGPGQTVILTLAISTVVVMTHCTLNFHFSDD